MRMDTLIYLEKYDTWYNFISDNGTRGNILELEEIENGFRILSFAWAMNAGFFSHTMTHSGHGLNESHGAKLFT